MFKMEEEKKIHCKKTKKTNKTQVIFGQCSAEYLRIYNIQFLANSEELGQT